MKKITLIILAIVIFAYIPLSSSDYSSKLISVILFLQNAQLIIQQVLVVLLNLTITILGIIGSKLEEFIVTDLYTFLINYPYEEVNLWYVLLVLLLISYFSEKFRTINNELNKVNRKLQNQKTNKESSIEMDKIDNLMIKAENITNLLKTLSTAADDLKNPVLRSKQLRRDSSLDLLSQEDNVKDNVAEYQTNDNQSISDDGIINSPHEIVDDDNISQIDLARALIASNDIDDAKTILQGIVNTGSEAQKHEAKLLYMQIK